MPGRGPAPQAQHQRERDTKRRVTDRQIVVKDDGAEVGPSIEDATLRSDWTPQTRQWWNVWRTSPQAKEFLGTDWNVLARCALLVERQILSPSGAIAAEIRLVEASLGATIADRQRLRLAIERDPEGEPAPVVRLASREDVKARLQGRS